METCRDRGFGPARPSGVDCGLETVEAGGEVDKGGRDPPDTEAADDCESRRRAKRFEAGGGRFSLSLVARRSDIADTFEPRRVFRTKRGEGGRELRAEFGRDGFSLGAWSPGDRRSAAV